MFNLYTRVTTPDGPGLLTGVGTVWTDGPGSPVKTDIVIVALDTGGIARFGGSDLYRVNPI